MGDIIRHCNNSVSVLDRFRLEVLRGGTSSLGKVEDLDLFGLFRFRG